MSTSGDPDENAECPVNRLIAEYDTVEELQREHEARWRKGVVVAPRSDQLVIGDLCDVVLCHRASGHRLPLRARVTSTALNGRVVCQIEDYGPEASELVRSFVDLCVDSQPPSETVPAAPVDVWNDLGDEDDGDDDPRSIHAKIPAHVHERLRGLPLHEVMRIARTGHQTERVVVERLYGKAVWEPLLQNPNLTPPEVARIARMGTLPRPLVDAIVSHPGWLTHSVVRRALLSNPRLGGQNITKVLRATPKSELKVIPQQTAYPQPVREAAKQLTKHG
jgi:hypothetical protein